MFVQKSARVVSIDGYEDVPSNDEKSLMKAVANQPVSVAIEAGGREFQLYESVTYSPICQFQPFISLWGTSHCSKSFCFGIIRLFKIRYSYGLTKDNNNYSKNYLTIACFAL